MVKRVATFLDANFLIALYSEQDIHHKNAVELSQHLQHPFTSDDVVDEAISVTLRKFGKKQAIEILDNITSSLPVFMCDKSAFEAGAIIFHTTPHNFSFTDCMVLAVLSVTGTHDIATFDKEFKKTNVTVVD
ncbi:MAG TPA: PIN domain-containing protein [Candidatus Nanoarchaeia archaeon]|nr:PIN domain-containing protein [Candidatus Nanoarchaeia archaeon]